MHEPSGWAVGGLLDSLALQALVAGQLGERPYVAVLAVAEAREGAAVVVEQVRAWAGVDVGALLEGLAAGRLGAVEVGR